MMTQTLSEISADLNRRNAPPGLPTVIFITDIKAVPRPEEIIEKLPSSAGIILRDYDHPAREEYCRALKHVAGDRLFLVAGDAELAEKIEADGLHLAERDLQSLADLKHLHPDWFFSISTHNEVAVREAERFGADLALLAPVFSTETHPGGQVLGVAVFEEIVKRAQLPLYALGGITADNATLLLKSRAAGLAAIRGWLKTT